MKKIYSIIALMLLFVGSAWGDNLIGDDKVITLGDKVTTPTEITSGYYILQNVEISKYYYESGSKIYMESSVNSAALVKITVLDAKDNGGNPQCTIQAYSGNYYANLATSQQITTVSDSISAGTFSIMTPQDHTGHSGHIWFKNGSNYINRSDDNTQGTGYTGTGAYSCEYVYKANIIDAINVTYKVVDSKNTVLISDTVKQAPNSAISQPVSFTNDYVTLSDPSGKIGTEDCEIIYTGTIHDLPFTPSTSYEDATWYYLKLKGTYLVYQNDDAQIPLQSAKSIGTAGQWAFVDTNPYQLKIINRKAGNNKYLNATDANKADANENAATVGVETTGVSNTWTLHKISNTSFSLRVSGSDYNCLNSRASHLGYWKTSASLSDAGSTFTFEKVDDNWLTELKTNAINELSNYVTNLPLLFDNEALTTVTNNINDATSSNYETVIASAKTTFIQTAVGKSFRLFNNHGRNKKPLVTIYDNGNQLALDTVSYQSEFQFEAYGSGLSLKNMYTGHYVQEVSSSARISTGTEPKAFTFTSSSPNTIAIGQSGQYTFFHQDASGNVVGWEASAEASVWRIIAFIETDENVLSGSAYKVEQINKGIGTKWGDYKATDEYTEAYSAFTTDGGNTKANYKAVLDNEPTKFVEPECLVNIAHTKAKGYSIGLTSDNQKIHAQTTNLTDANQLWKVTVPSHGVVNFFNVNAQQYMGNNVGGTSNTVSLSDTPANWSITWDADTFKLHNGNNNLNFETNTSYYGNLNQWYDNDTWAATPVASIKLPVHPVGNYSYATICYPFEVELSAGAAYKATYNSTNSSLTLASIGQTVPAGTPVVVVVENATTDSITATIKGTDTKAIQTSDDNALSGTYLPLAITADNDSLTLGTDGTNAGFYKWAGTIQNKAFYVYSGNTSDAQARGFAFSFGDDDPTGISEDLIREAVKELQGQRYNVQGQPVGADYKGIVIQNGKKYLQK